MLVYSFCVLHSALLMFTAFCNLCFVLCFSSFCVLLIVLCAMKLPSFANKELRDFLCWSPWPKNPCLVFRYSRLISKSVRKPANFRLLIVLYLTCEMHTTVLSKGFKFIELKTLLCLHICIIARVSKDRISAKRSETFASPSHNKPKNHADMIVDLNR